MIFRRCNHSIVNFNIFATLKMLSRQITTLFRETNFEHRTLKEKSSIQGGKPNHVRWRFSKPRQKMPSCSMHLADTMKFRPYLAMRTVVDCVSTYISASPGKCRCTTRYGKALPRLRSSRNERLSRSRECENTPCFRRSEVSETNPLCFFPR